MTEENNMVKKLTAKEIHKLGVEEAMKHITEIGYNGEIVYADGYDIIIYDNDGGCEKVKVFARTKHDGRVPLSGMVDNIIADSIIIVTCLWYTTKHFFMMSSETLLNNCGMSVGSNGRVSHWIQEADYIQYRVR